MSLDMGPIRLAAKKPMPPHASRQSCRMATLLQVAAAYKPQDSTRMRLPATGPPRTIRSWIAAGGRRITRSRLVGDGGT
jgi:hypothetical protein